MLPMIWKYLLDAEPEWILKLSLKLTEKHTQTFIHAGSAHFERPLEAYFNLGIQISKDISRTLNSSYSIKRHGHFMI